MLSDAKVSIIQQLKGTTKFNARFIRDFDREWDAVVGQLRNSKKNLANITLVPANVEYRNVRT